MKNEFEEIANNAKLFNEISQISDDYFKKILELLNKESKGLPEHVRLLSSMLAALKVSISFLEYVDNGSALSRKTREFIFNTIVCSMQFNLENLLKKKHALYNPKMKTQVFKESEFRKD